MDPTRFEQIVSAYGADPVRWPLAERAAALAFAEDHPEIAGPLLAREQDLDALLAAASAPMPSRDLQDRLMESLPAGQPPAVPAWAAMAASIALVTGAALGFAGSALLGEPQWSEEALFTAAFDSLDTQAAWSLEDTE